MKKLLAFLLMFIVISVSAQIAKKSPYRVIRTLTADLNNDGKNDTINLISSLDGRNNFNRISVSLTGFGKSVFNAKDYWTVVDSFFMIKNKNLIKTKLLFAKKTDKHAAILLFGEMDGAGYRGEFSMINIENNSVKMVFDHSVEDAIDVEVPIELSDLGHNDRLCLVYTTITECAGSSGKDKETCDIFSYAPRFVYPVSDLCRMDKELSKKYMDENYVFAGFKYDEKILIYHPRNGGKPRIWKKAVIN